MPDAGTAAATAASGAATVGDGSESGRHRHRAQQGDADRPDTGAAAPQTSSGVLGESNELQFPLAAAVYNANKEIGRAGGCWETRRVPLHQTPRVTVLLSPRRGRPKITK